MKLHHKMKMTKLTLTSNQMPFKAFNFLYIRDVMQKIKALLTMDSLYVHLTLIAVNEELNELLKQRSISLNPSHGTQDVLT